MKKPILTFDQMSQEQPPFTGETILVHVNGGHWSLVYWDNRAGLWMTTSGHEFRLSIHHWIYLQ
jgi:hypothetical protein